MVCVMRWVCRVGGGEIEIGGVCVERVLRWCFLIFIYGWVWGKIMICGKKKIWGKRKMGMGWDLRNFLYKREEKDVNFFFKFSFLKFWGEEGFWVVLMWEGVIGWRGFMWFIIVGWNSIIIIIILRIVD